MFSRLQISDRRERWMVGLTDAVLAAAGAAVHPFARRLTAAPPHRILLVRLERIGDLLMTRDAMAAVRSLAPAAHVDLVVGSWNVALARLLGVADSIEQADAPWLARSAGGDGIGRLARRFRGWHSRRYDLAINFEGDIRSHALMALAAAPRRIGFDMAGGGPLLTDCVRYDPREHTAANALRLVEHAFAKPPGSLRPGLLPPLAVPPAAEERARQLLGRPPGRDSAPLVGIHVSGGREIKQWALSRFAGVGRRLAEEAGAVLVMTGSTGDRPAIEAVRRLLPAHVSVIDLARDLDLVTLAAALRLLDVFITGDTGPMHLAAAVGTPLVAIFGPSDPARWGPLSPGARVVRAGIACSPCNRIRRPPARCVGHVPDCLEAVDATRVFEAARELLELVSKL